MQAETNVLIDGKEFTLGVRMGKGEMGLVYAIQEQVDKQSWVVKVPINADSAMIAALKEEYQVMNRLSGGMPVPFIPRVKKAETIPNGGFALAMESVGEELQLLRWVQSELNRGDGLKGEIAIWRIVSDYLELIRVVHQELGVSVRDRKMSDFRYLPSDDPHHPRLIVIDWGLQSNEKDPINDILIFGQLFYSMITSLSIDARDESYSYLTSKNWGNVLSIGGRKILANSLQRRYESIRDLAEDVTNWRRRLESARAEQLLAIIEESAEPQNEQELELKLINLDLLKRLSPEKGEQLYESFAQTFFAQPEAELETLKRRTQDRLAEAQQNLERLKQIWQQDYPSLVEILSRWELEIRDLQEQEEQERMALGTRLFLDYRNIATSTLHSLEQSKLAFRQSHHFDELVPQLQAQKQMAESLLARIPPDAAAPRTKAKLAYFIQELAAISFLLQSEQALQRGDFKTAYAALDSIKGLDIDDRSIHIDSRFRAIVSERIRRLRDASQLDPRDLETLSSLRDLIERGNYRDAVALYQNLSITLNASALTRLLWEETIEPAYLAMHLEQGEWSIQQWLKLMTKFEQYLRQKPISRAFVNHTQRHLSKPYEAFQEAAKIASVDMDITAIILGQLLLTIDRLCQSIIGENS